MIISTDMLDIANTQVDEIVKRLRQDLADGHIVNVEEITVELASLLQDNTRNRQAMAILLAVALQRLAWK